MLASLSILRTNQSNQTLWYNANNARKLGGCATHSHIFVRCNRIGDLCWHFDPYHMWLSLRALLTFFFASRHFACFCCFIFPGEANAENTDIISTWQICLFSETVRLVIVQLRWWLFWPVWRVAALASTKQTFAKINVKWLLWLLSLLFANMKQLYISAGIWFDDDRFSLVCVHSFIRNTVKNKPKRCPA